MMATRNSLLTLALLICSLLQEQARAATNDRAHTYQVPSDLVTDSIHRNRDGRGLANINGTCSLCGSYQLRSDVIPEGTDNVGNSTCLELSERAAGYDDPQQCADITQWLYRWCCTGYVPYQCETRVRNALIQADTYDPVVPPIVSSVDPLNVTVNLWYLHVSDINVHSGTMEIFVWLDLSWRDQRLSWTISDEFCASTITARGSLDPETTEIWVPDIDLLNKIEGVHEFGDQFAYVDSDGSVFLRRAGTLKVICQFTDLSKIPFDNLGCQLLFGGLSSSQGLTYILDETSGGLEFGNFTPTFNEFRVTEDRSDVGINNAGTIFYTFYFRRATRFYTFHIVTPTIILTYVSFGTFLLDIRVGERLSYGMALALVIVAQQIITGDLLTVSNERLWLDKFVGWSFYWVIFGLAESVFVGYIYFRQQDKKDEEKPEQPPESSPEATTAMEGAILNEEDEDARDKSSGKKSCSEWMTELDTHRIDHIWFFTTIATYTLYVICMFATIPVWGSNNESVYRTAD